MFVPTEVVIIPEFFLMRYLGWLDTLLPLIVPSLLVGAFGTLMMTEYFKSIPRELEEAALVDGASVWVSFFKIVLPIVLPGIASAFILCLILCWNEYFLAALITSTDAKTMPVMVASQISSQSIKWWNMAAISAALCLPLIIVAIFLERYIVKGMAAGAVKQ